MSATTVQEAVILTEPSGPGQLLVTRGVLLDGREYLIPSGSEVLVSASDTKPTTVTVTLLVSTVRFEEVHSATNAVSSEVPK